MATPFDLSVALRRPPHKSTSGEKPAVKNAATAGAGALAAVDLLGASDQNAYVMFRFDQDGYIAFGKTNAVVATNLDWPVKAGEVFEWLCLAGHDRYFSLLRAGGTDVTCRYYFTDRADEG